MGYKLVNKCCQTKTCLGKPVECNLREVKTIIAERHCKFTEKDIMILKL